MANVSSKQIRGFVIGAVAVAAIVALVWALTKPAPLTREAYIARRAEWAKRLNTTPAAELPTKTPEAYYRQEFFATLDPALGYPTVDELYRELDARQAVTIRQRKLGRSTTSGELTWTSLGPNNQGGRARALAWDPNDPMGRKVWAAGVSGGLWYNDDITSATSPWQRVNDLWENLNITSIAIDPTNSQVMYVGTGEAFAGEAPGAGVWKTTNGGTTWARLPNTADMYFINDIAVRNESGTGVLYVGTTNAFYEGIFQSTTRNRGLWRSTNGGTSFTQVLPTVPGQTTFHAVADIEIGADNRIYVGTARNSANHGGGYVLYSDDGVNWITNAQFLTGGATPVTGARRVELACAPNNPNVVYALIEGRNPGSQAGALARSNNKGGSFTLRAEPNDVDNGISATDFTRGQAFYDLILAVDPNDSNVVIVGGINLFRSTNGATSWSHISKWSNNPNMNTLSTSLVHADQHAVVFKPGSSVEAIFGTDGGIYWSNRLDIAATSSQIRQRSLDQVTTQFYRGDVSSAPARPFMMGGTQDNGTILISNSTYGGGDEIYGGDGAYCEFDPIGDRQIVSYVFNNYAMYYNNFSEGLILVDESTGDFINSADADWQNDWLFSGESTTEVRATKITTDAMALSSSPLPVPGLDDFASAITVSPATTAGSSVVWLGTASGKLLRAVYNGAGFTATDRTNPTFPVANLASVSFGANENSILVTFSNYGVSSVFLSLDGGVNFADKEGNLPNIPVRTAVFNPNNPNQVFVGTDLGVYMTSNIQAPSPTWVLQSNGFANVKVTELRISATLGKIFAWTYGRGMWSAPLPVPTSNEQTASAALTEVQVFPNPFADELRIRLDATTRAKAELTLIGMDGREALRLRSDAADEVWVVDTRRLAAGSYALLIEADGRRYAQRVIRR